MIRVIVSRNDNFINKVHITGHAMYAPIGKDIVCSAVSSIVITSVNGILSLDKEAILYEYQDNGLLLTIKKEDVITNTLLENMINLLRELQKKYKDNIIVQ